MTNKLTQWMSQEPSWIDWFSSFEERIDNMFDSIKYTNGWGDLFKTSGRDYPRTDIVDSDVQLIIEMAVPGWRDKEIDVDIENGVLIVTGRLLTERQKRNYLSRTIGRRDFERRYKLPEIDIDKVTAKLCDGILTIVLPKTHAENPKRINIKINKDE